MRQKSKSKKGDPSPVVHQNSKINFDLQIRQKQPLTDRQKELLSIIYEKDNKIILINGKAGTSKTFLSVLAGLQLMNEKRISDIIYLRSTTQAKDGVGLGFLPGTMAEKMEYFNIPLIDKLEEFISKGNIERLKKENRLKLYPTSMLRGYSFNSSFVIADEAQVMTFDSLTTIAQRTGQFSKLIIAGDTEGQNDLGSKSGFKDFYNLFDEESRTNGIACFRFGLEDIVRSGICRYVCEKTEKMLLNNSRIN